MTATVNVGALPSGVAVDGEHNLIYVANSASDTVSVIDGSAGTVIAAIPAGAQPIGVAVLS